MFSSLLILFEEYPVILTILDAIVILGAIGFVLMMVFNIKSFLAYRKRKSNNKNKQVERVHSTFFWVIDGFFTFLFSLDFLSLIFIFL